MTFNMTETIKIKEIKVNGAIEVKVDSELCNNNDYYNQALKKDECTQ